MWLEQRKGGQDIGNRSTVDGDRIYIRFQTVSQTTCSNGSVTVSILRQTPESHGLILLQFTIPVTETGLTLSSLPSVRVGQSYVLSSTLQFLG
jgi:hypothetical protein